MQGKCTFLQRTVNGISELLKPLEECVRAKLIPAISGRPSCSNLERQLLSLPSNMGGMGIRYPTNSESSYTASSKITSSLTEKIILQDIDAPLHTDETGRIKAEVRQQKNMDNRMKLEEIQQQLTYSQQRLLECSLEKGASNWVTAIPLEKYGYMLHKGDFRDAIYLRYGWQIQNLPTHCDCGMSMSVDHALICHKGGYPSIRHNEIRDLSAALLSEVCSSTSIEPGLQPLSGEDLDYETANRDKEARLDIKTTGFWRSGQDAFFDVRVFHPNTSSYRHKSLSSLYRQHEKEKKRSCGQRVREVERAAFTPLVLSTTGGMASECSMFFKRLSQLIAEKRNLPYHQMISWLRCRISFALLRQGIMALRGSRSFKRRVQIPDDISHASNQLSDHL